MILVEVLGFSLAYPFQPISGDVVRSFLSVVLRPINDLIEYCLNDRSSLNDHESFKNAVSTSAAMSLPGPNRIEE